MDSTLSVTLTQMALSKALNRHFITAPLTMSLSQCASRQLLLHRRLNCLSYYHGIHPRSTSFASSPSSSLLRTLYTVVPRASSFPIRCVSSSAASFAYSGGGNGGVGGENGGGGGGGAGGESGDTNPKLVGEGAEELLALSPDVIILDVGGMVCGGCAANVKRILEGRPQVSSANVNLTTETAVVWPASEAKTVPNWQKQLGEALAEHLTSCGFKSSLRVAGQEESN